VRPGPLTTPDSSAQTTVSGIGERALIDRIRRRLPPAPRSLVVGIGDDAAVDVGERGSFSVLSVDALVEGVHFDRRFSSLGDVGYKALAVNLSDLAAMGASPRLALLSLILPEPLLVTDVDDLLDGLLAMAAQAGVTLAGGNISRSPGPLVIDVTVTGAVRPRRVLTRGGGRAGDQLYVSGHIGAGAAGLEWLREHGATGGEAPGDPALAECVARHRRPEPRTRLGRLLGQTRTASACMDLSDGLADAVRQVAHASGTGARIDAGTIPIHPGAAGWFRTRGGDPLVASLSGGDDYELLFAVAHRRRGGLRLVGRQARGLALTRIGELTADRAIRLERDGVPVSMPEGFTHF
jgi:thiamine-monophosphate kinase